MPGLFHGSTYRVEISGTVDQQGGAVDLTYPPTIIAGSEDLGPMFCIHLFLFPEVKIFRSRCQLTLTGVAFPIRYYDDEPQMEVYLQKRILTGASPYFAVVTSPNPPARDVVVGDGDLPAHRNRNADLTPWSKGGLIFIRIKCVRRQGRPSSMDPADTQDRVCAGGSGRGITIDDCDQPFSGKHDGTESGHL
jgi:hypothetical protein